MGKLRAFLVTTAKNEGPYFLEWVAHHLEVGFTDIVIFQNDSDDLTHETLCVLREIGAIQYYYNRAAVGRHQVRAYERAATLEEYANADWAMALDMDEFLVIKTGDGRLADLISAAPKTDLMMVNWRMFGSSGFEPLNEDLVTERFTMANHQLGGKDQFGAFKALFRPSRFRRPGIHRPHQDLDADKPLKVCNGSGLALDDYAVKNYNSTDPGGCSLAQINHYMVRDLSSFMLKAVRGSAHQANRTIGHRYWTQRNTNFAEDTSMSPWVARVRERMAALDEASDGRLMELRQASVFTHLARYYAMLQERRFRGFRSFCLAHQNATDHRGAEDEVASAKPVKAPAKKTVAARAKPASAVKAAATARATDKPKTIPKTRARSKAKQASAA